MMDQCDYGFAEAVPVPFGILGPGNEIRAWNSRLEMLTGLSAGVVIGSSLAELAPALGEALEVLAGTGEPVSVPLSLLSRDDTVACNRSALTIKLKPFHAPDGAVAGTAVLASCEGEVFHGLDDIFNFIQSLSRDDMLYEQAAERIEERQQKILQSEKLAGIGHLAAGVAHEINNPVGYIYSNLNALRDYVSDVVTLIDGLDAIRAMAGENRQVADYVDGLKRRADLDFLKDDLVNVVSESLDGVERVKQIVKSLKDFSHIDDNEFTRYDVIDGIEATLKVANNEIKYKADISRDYGPAEVIECLPSQINQVILNLLVNAAQAMSERGTITLRTGGDTTGVWFEVEDTGCGIEEPALKRLFEPFYTTKPVGQGTGLGLSLSYSIVRKHGGDITVRSRPGQGTCFRVRLPREQQAVEKIA